MEDNGHAVVGRQHIHIPIAQIERGRVGGTKHNLPASIYRIRLGAIGSGRPNVDNTSVSAAGASLANHRDTGGVNVGLATNSGNKIGRNSRASVGHVQHTPSRTGLGLSFNQHQQCQQNDSNDLLHGVRVLGDKQK